jgi:hypothetical protein
MAIDLRQAAMVQAWPLATLGERRSEGNLIGADGTRDDAIPAGDRANFAGDTAAPAIFSSCR